MLVSHNSMISRNSLTAYSDDQFLNQDFTYDSAHAYVKYYPYYTFDGDKSQYDMKTSLPICVNSSV